MAYRLKNKESVPDGIRRIVGEEIDAAVAGLGARTRAQRDSGIHEARKSIKKIRGILRLLRGELGSVYGKENEHFRGIGHKLSELRDAAALLEVFQHIESSGTDGTGSASRRTIRLGLEREKKRLETRLDAARVAARAARILQEAKARLDGWPLKRAGFAALAPGLKETYRQGRKALKKARRTQAAADFHEYRKRVKDHWYHVRLLESTWTEVMQGQEASLKELETWLGDDHNLVVLRSTLEAHPARFGGKEMTAGFLKVVAQQQEELREKSLSLGERVYRDKPGAFVGNVEALWEAWRQQPESMNEVEKEVRNAPLRKPAKSAAARKTKDSAA